MSASINAVKQSFSLCFCRQLFALLLIVFSISAFAVDTDGDGVDDSVDAFPNDACAWADSDNDGYPDTISSSCYGTQGFEGSISGWSFFFYSGTPSYSKVYTGITSPHTGTHFAEVAFGGKVTVTLKAAIISFWYFGTDRLNFIVDGVQIASLQTEYPAPTDPYWQQYSYVLPTTGVHTFTWTSPGCGFCVNRWMNLDDVSWSATTLVADNCPLVANPDQTDTDHDGIGDACDTKIAPNGLTYAFDYANSLDPNGSITASSIAPNGYSYRYNEDNGLDPNVPLSQVKSDFDADRKSDVLFINTTTGGTKYWQAAAKSQSVYVGTYDHANYSYAGSGDFDGDKKADLLFVKSSNNATLIWSGAVKTAASYPGTVAAGFSVAAICDTTGDGKDDVVWYNATTAKTQVWPSATKTGILYPGSGVAGFSIVACADFDGDGKADLFWHNAASGANQIWNGAVQANKTYPGTNSDVTMTVVGAGDIDGDGKSDLVWYKPSTGAINVWKGGLKSAASYLGANATAFSPKAIGDYDGDGKADLLWSNDTTLMTQIWPAFVKANSFNPGTSPSGFSIQK